MPAPTAAHSAAPSALLSVTTGTCTGSPVTSAMICGQSVPFAAPPVKTSSLMAVPVSPAMMSRCPRATYAAASWIARTHALRPDLAGSLRSKPRNEGAACTQRLAFIRFDMIASTPPEPGGTRAAPSSITT